MAQGVGTGEYPLDIIPEGWVLADAATRLSGLKASTLRTKAEKGEIERKRIQNGRWHYNPDSLPRAAEPASAPESERDRLWRALERTLDDRSRDVRDALDRIKDEQQNAAKFAQSAVQLTAIIDRLTQKPAS